MFSHDTPGTNLSFDRLIAPLSPKEFLEDYWEQKALYIPRADVSYYGELGSLRHIDGLLSRSGDGQLLSISTAVVDPETGENRVRENGIHARFSHQDIYDALSRGETVRVRGVERLLDGGQAVAAGIEAATNAMVRINMYLTPRGSRGFGIHQDAHDVFVIQGAGKKHWRIYDDPVAIPSDRVQLGRTELFGSEVTSRASIPNGDHKAERTVTHDLVIEPGDFMYIPRGVYHEAFTTDELSMHYTIGVYPLTWHDAAMYALARVFERDVRLRKALPVGFAEGRASREVLEAAAQDAIAAIGEGLDTETMLESVREVGLRFLNSRSGVFHGFIQDLDSLTALGKDDEVEVRTGLVLRTRQDQERIYLLYNGRSVRLPIDVAPAIDFMRSGSPFTAASLPIDYDDDDKLKVVRHLVKQGLLTRASGTTHGDGATTSHALPVV